MKSLKQRFLHFTRTLHTYLTMFALVLLLFFSLTGFLMNHEDTFALAAPHITTHNTTVPTTLLKDKLMLVEHLRKHADARGEMISFDESEDALRLQFTSPGRKSDYLIKPDGTTEITAESRGLIGLAADLHMGKNVTLPWKLIIDSAALFLFLASLSGLVLWLSMPKRRALGLLALALSIALCLLTYLLLTP